MALDSLYPSQVSPDFSGCSQLSQPERNIAAAILHYLAAHGDQWREMSWGSFVLHLRSTSREQAVPCAHEARSGFAYQLADQLSSASMAGLISYRQEGGRDYFAVTPMLMEVYGKQPRRKAATRREPVAS